MANVIPSGLRGPLGLRALPPVGCRRGAVTALAAVPTQSLILPRLKEAALIHRERRKVFKNATVLYNAFVHVSLVGGVNGAPFLPVMQPADVEVVAEFAFATDLRHRVVECLVKVLIPRR